MTRDLTGRRVLVTRPAGQGEGLAQQLEALGAEVLQRPALAIEPRTPADWPPAEPVDWLVFTSPNAVQWALPWLDSIDRSRAQIAAVGPGTAARAQADGLPVAVAPRAGGGVDELLAEPDFAPAAGERVLIFRGEGGRERLQQVLREGQVIVVEADVYRRVPAGAALDVPLAWRSAPLDATVVTSRAGLDALLGMTGQPALQWLQASRLITVSDRVAAYARAMGFVDPVVAAGAADADLSAAVVQALQREGND